MYQNSYLIRVRDQTVLFSDNIIHTIMYVDLVGRKFVKMFTKHFNPYNTCNELAIVKNYSRLNV